MLKTVFLFCLLTVFFQKPPAHDIQGTYVLTVNKKQLPKSGRIFIHYTPNNKILFYLEAARVEDGNSGAEYNELTYNKAGFYQSDPVDIKEGCRLVFKKTGKQITVTTAAGDCGFGYGVTADGTYTLKSSENPQFILTRTGKKVYFDKTPPGKFTED